MIDSLVETLGGCSSPDPTERFVDHQFSVHLPCAGLSHFYFQYTSNRTLSISTDSVVYSRFPTERLYHFQFSLNENCS